jgi:sec-independent protein translocase protein TatC
MAPRTVRNAEGRRVMSLAGHLGELRRRGTRIAIGIIAGAVGGWFLADWVWEALRLPIAQFAATGDRTAAINFGNITSAFDLKMQIAIIAGIVISSPWWLYQVFAFFMPALTRNESRYVIGFLGSAIPLFLGGCLAGWLLIPHVVLIMLGFASPDDTTLLGAKEYLDFSLKLVLVTGAAFVLPVFLVLLNFAGVISARAILKGWRVAILLITLFTAIATPAADVMSMFALAVPMVALYFAAVGVAAIHDRRAARQLERAELAEIGSTR